MRLVESGVVGRLRERLRRDVDGSIGRAEILEEARDRHQHDVVLALTERRSFFGEHADDRVDMAA